MEQTWIYLIVCVVPWITDSQARHHQHVIVHQQTTPQASCVYGNSSYPAGTRFRPDPCTFCHCPRQGGRADCAVEDCRYEANCYRSVMTPDSQCCEICVETGCRWTDGRVYKGGDVMRVSDCQTCRCPEDGGVFECTRTSCPSPECVNPVKPSDGSCCLVCPDGPNCWLGKRLISAGETVREGRCKTCSCPYKHASWVSKRGPRATCTSQDCNK